MDERPGWLDRQMERATRQVDTMKAWERGEEAPLCAEIERLKHELAAEREMRPWQESHYQAVCDALGVKEGEALLDVARQRMRERDEARNAALDEAARVVADLPPIYRSEVMSTAELSRVILDQAIAVIRGLKGGGAP